MSTIINCSIDVKMITKGKIKIHPNGSHYWNFSVLERKEPDDFGNTHYVVEQQTKEERDAKEPKNYLKSSGKAIVFGDANTSVATKPANDFHEEDEEDLPF